MSCLRANNADVKIEPQEKLFKILLVGAGDSGKSTIFKQMRILYKQGYSEQELQNHRPVVYENILRAMMALVKASVALNIPIQNEENQVRARTINDFDQRVLTNVKSIWNDELARSIEELWKDKGIQDTYDLRSEFQIDDSASYYFSNMDRICQASYVPTTDDVVRSRVKTTGINETDFTVKEHKFIMVDVGGQRNERKKWIHCFEDVNAIIFVSSLSEFDQRCYEDDQTNRMSESLKLFDEYCNSHWFSNTLVYLMMNKSDIFETKIQQGKDLKKTFPDWTGGDADAAKEFVKKKYQEKDRENKLRQIYYTNAVNREALKVELDGIVQHIIQNAKDKPKGSTGSNQGNQSFRSNRRG
ncbi:guanine nucleotide-binding protein G(i) subunit alpha [Acrasis kona]|uniref:Guanine nucleotide-binding protein G(I) subunit alpha n=1 Tax=Acrasis kona TaxID=1008807 RepID=A0AAW2Z5H7_9EUKA